MINYKEIIIFIVSHLFLELFIIREKNEKNIRDKFLNIKNQNNEYSLNDIVSNKTRIPVCYATDENNVYPTLVSMTSLVENAGPNTFYDIFIMHPEKFNIVKNRKIFKSVEKSHSYNCSINLINMENKYEDLPFKKNKTMAPAYYRLDIHNVLSRLNRAIWLDGDTLVFEDLTNLINIDMKSNYILGFLDSGVNHMEEFGLKNSTVLCSGVLLIDLDSLRKNNYTQKINKFLYAEKDRLFSHDQTVINVIFHGKKDFLPPKYGMWAFGNKKKAKNHLNILKPYAKYNEKEFIYAMEHPAILHYIWPKPFWKNARPTFRKEWWEYARKTGYFKEIFKFVKNYKHK